MIEPLALPASPAVLDLLPALAAAAAGDAPIAPYAAGAPRPELAAYDPDSLPEAAALVISTSGSTGEAKRAVLTASALAASADATHERLGGPGQWLLALPPHHIGGLQVLLRSMRAGVRPAVLDLSDGFDPGAFATAVAELDPRRRRYVSLVPVQLTRILQDPRATAAAAELDALLLGGQGLDPTLRARAEAAGLTIVATYGMTETAGGCVYDGKPLAQVRVGVEDTGRILLGGPTLASGYLGEAAATATAFHGSGDQRWLRTDDAGHLDPDGRLHVDSRLDDLITTGGLKVAPRLVEEAIRARLPEVIDVCAVGTADPVWGEAVSVAVVLAASEVSGGVDRLATADLRNRLRGDLPAHALPRRALVVAALPTRGPGKPDRGAVRALFVPMGE